jgi:hypothetical protein
MSVGMVVTAVLLVDLRVLGLLSRLERDAFLGLMREIAAGAFTVAVLTGLALFSIRAQEYATNVAFQAKLALLALAGLNLLAFRLLDRNRAAHDGHAPGTRALAALSLVLWPSILVAGRFIGFV